MIRPCFLVVDREFVGSISTRKLVIETAKFNVITAYSFTEALATLERFPGVSGVVASSTALESCSAFTSEVRKRYPEMKIIVTGHAGPDGYGPIDQVVESYSPDLLLRALRAFFPEQSADVQRREMELEPR